MNEAMLSLSKSGEKTKITNEENTRQHIEDRLEIEELQNRLECKYGMTEDHIDKWNNRVKDVIEDIDKKKLKLVTQTSTKASQRHKHLVLNLTNLFWQSLT